MTIECFAVDHKGRGKDRLIIKGPDLYPLTSNVADAKTLYSCPLPPTHKRYEYTLRFQNWSDLYLLSKLHLKEQDNSCSWDENGMILNEKEYIGELNHV